MRFGILGPLDIRADDGTSPDPGGPRPRALLTLLLLEAGRTVSARRLIDGLYGTEPPAGAANALQSQISRLRGRLRPHTEIEITSAGYRIAVPPEAVDAHLFEQLSRDGRAALAAGDHPQAAARLREALALWRGPALPDLPDAYAEVARLDELQLAAVQDRIEADLVLGGGPELVPEVRALLAAHPLSERLYGQLMRALHASGRPAEALGVYEEARSALARELGADPSPDLAALHLELLRGEAPAPRRPRVPAQLTRFFGRRAELARITALLTDSAPRPPRLITLTGPGGVGKTRLAFEAARVHADTSARVCVTELAPLTDGTQIPYAVLAALGVREGPRAPGTPVTEAVERLLAALEERELLLVLDNCEHLVEEAARLVGLLLGGCPGLRVLATGRESLGITGEILVPVPPLPPDSAGLLFLDRAQAVRPGPERPFDEPHARVADICAALDGLPLAIELAAARLRTLTVDELADRLDTRLGTHGPVPETAHAPDRFRLLSRGDRTKAPRHRTLRAVVEWSWELLDGEEREAARRLAVFSGGATAEAVEAVCGVPYAEDVLASLVEKSLVEVADGRYRMLETIRAYAAERLAEEDDPGRLRDAHAGCFLALAERAEPFLRSAGQLPWLERLTAEHGNLDAALRHLVRTDTGSALRLMAALSWFWRLRGPQGEHLPMARALLAAVGEEPPPGLAEEYALCVMNTVAGRGDDPGEPERLARVAAVLRTLRGPLRLPATTVIWSLVGGPVLSVEEEIRAVHISDEPWGRALLDVGLAYQALFAGRPAGAEAAFTRALTGFRATGDRWGMANCLDPLASLADWHGDHERALELLDEGLAQVRELQAPEETADLLRTRATVLLHRGDTEEAAAHYTRSAALARAAGAHDKVASARRGLGDLARLAGDTAHARVHYENALKACAANWFSVGETVRILIGLGRNADAEGDTDAARDWFARAETHARDSTDALARAELADALASVAPTAERAAELLGAAEALRGARVAGDPDVVRTERAVRARLSPEAYDRAFEQGFEQGLRLGPATVSER
ncbi:BTAD domain-containing putative transcriptional regulator [Streptomyces griseiscabiei]|uniref:BTAD domain-containing putative transcriptional regulator n=1 Tax=Streptomyces griseiscabiei TaxID=2993540 RepID=A0ABU4LCB6_9ACTN|nr:BTAD domain-containing putative transcriptional regulator [Streptomyces griseiscabiei]MBZ3904034.1 tetratricopeptide repeat protein [Streptomyces griseiscabiei]MDX2912960.1 BTAD domain-containing putative transcriptional regulator [Streptomyces griseiscabiei]